MTQSHFMRITQVCALEKTTENLLERAEILEQMVFFDPVTSLPNRSGMAKELAALKSKPFSELALLHIKLIGYHNFYDSFGHEFSISIIKEVIDRLNARTHESGMIYRCSDDQFSVLLVHDFGRDEVISYIRDLTQVLEIPFEVERLSLSLPCNIGLAFANSSDEIEKLPVMARSACEFAAESNSPWHVFDNSLFANMREEIMLQSDLRRAVNNHELSMVYQPKVCTTSGDVCGVEALLRWKHPALGWVSPVQFIPLAERYGLIRIIGQWALKQSIEQAAIWFRQGFNLRMSVNLSAQQLEDDGLCDIVKVFIETSGINPSLICLEITESVAMMRPEFVAKTLMDLRGLGLELSIDDFGTGHSSLSYLYSFPVNELKLDRSFVLAMAKGSLPIIEASVHMARALGMRVVAEGIETHEQRDLLIRCGCDELQGYLFSKPMPPHLFPIFMDNWDSGSAVKKQGI